jgi:flagellar biosynthesis protein FliR
LQELISLIDQPTVLAFLLLLARVLSFMAFMPIIGEKTVNPTIRIAASFYITIFLFPLIDYNTSVVNTENFLLALISEITLGLIASFLVQIIFSAVQIIGDLVEYATALSMAKMFDPASGSQQGLVSRLLYLVVLVVYFETGMYEITIYILSQSFGHISLGTFDLFSYDGIAYATEEIKRMFGFAFAFAFPLFFVGFILDLYYGYGTKSMPAFSPFIVTFQLKFALIFIFMMLGMEVFVDGFTNYFIGKLEG